MRPLGKTWLSRRIGSTLMRAIRAKLRVALLVGIIALTTIAIGTMVAAQYHDARKLQEPNFSRGSISFGAEEGSGVAFSHGVAVRGGSWAQMEGDSPKPDRLFGHYLVFNTEDVWGDLIVTSASFDPGEGLLRFQAYYEPSDDLPDEVRAVPLAPLMVQGAWFALKGAPALTKVDSQVDGDTVAITIKLDSGMKLWPFDKYEGYLWVVLEAPSWVEEDRTVPFAKDMKLLPDTFEGEGSGGITILPIRVGSTDHTAFSAPPGYHLRLGASAGSEIGAPLWIFQIRQELWFPRVGFVLISVLYVGVLALMGWRAIQRSSPLEIGALALTLVLGVSLVSSLLGEPSIPWPTMVDVLRFGVILFGLLIVSASLIRAVRRPHTLNRLHKPQD